MKEFSGLGKFITVQIGRSTSRWQGGTSYHITSSLTNIAQLCLLENIFPMGRKTGIFKGCGSHLKLQERWASVCLLLGKELLVDVFKFTSHLCSNGCKTCIWRVNVFFVHLVPNREFQPLETSQTCHSRFVSLFQLLLIYDNKIPAKWDIKLDNVISK